MKKKILMAIMTLAGVLICIVSLCDTVVTYSAQEHLYNDAATTPHREMGLVLGTSPISTWSGRRNYYFDYRIEAAAKLYTARKVNRLIVSGGDYRSNGGYDEPAAMRDSLIKQGVDSDHIILDYEGTRTLNSIAKMHTVYHQDSFVVISQKYHNERALYQAKHLGAEAIAFNAKTPRRRTSWLRNRGREVLARVKLFIDIASGVQSDFKESTDRDS